MVRFGPVESNSDAEEAMLTLWLACGWYAQPGNWRANTLIAAGVIVGMVAVTWKFSAERETWARKPEPGEWHPSR
ncbi:hypothetical protein E4U53_001715 [Claviceps sorghi]|nr:hypothetical protein E4U53_001715 [Claviceps sorghi]